jgi:hypothetical protein
MEIVNPAKTQKRGGLCLHNTVLENPLKPTRKEHKDDAKYILAAPYDIILSEK